MARGAEHSESDDIETGILQRRRDLRTTFGTQANAILRKNLIFQKRNWKTSCCLVSLPPLLCLGLLALQIFVDIAFSGSDFKCGCKCVETTTENKCVRKECGYEYSNSDQAGYCAVNHPPEWPAFQQIGKSQYRAVQRGSPSFGDLPDPSCRDLEGGCPATVLYTGSNKTFADQLGVSLLDQKSLTALIARYKNASEGFLTEAILATSNSPSLNLFFETGGSPGKDEEDIQPSRYLQYSCQSSNSISFSTDLVSQISTTLNLSCLDVFSTWRSGRDAINKELYAGYYKSRTYGSRVINEYAGAYDFQDSTPKKFNPIVYYNDTIAGSEEATRTLLRIPRAINLATNAFVRVVLGSNFSVPLKFVKEYPKPQTKLSLDFSSILGPLFYMWLLLLLYPIILGALVYEKEGGLRTMMKMHGLGSPAYWIVTYLYYLILSTVYVLFLMIFGTLIGLKFFKLNDYALQFIFYFVFMNTQISFSFLSSTIFSNAKVATVCGYLYVILFGLLGQFLFSFYLEYSGFPNEGIVALELLPAFALYRGLYEFGQYSFDGNYLGTDGMMFKDLNDPQNGYKEAITILAIEWIVFLVLSLYLDQVVSSGSGIRKHPLYFLNYLGINFDKSARDPDKGHLLVEDDKRERPGVAQEKEVVESLRGINDGYSIVCNNLQKVYPGTDGNPAKFAVREMYLAVPRGECFGMLGPNGAGKTTSINMMIGFLSPTSGHALIEGLDIGKDMDDIYSIMGVCPQHDLLWDQLTGREHLLFYGRLKNLKGNALEEAVENSLKSVNLFYGGDGNKVSGAYSGGMKRRLSVAISLIGNPLVVYMDEPSTGLDPASRKSLWNVVKNAKKDRAIILTTHSMEEAEALCDRLGIFVDGRFECIGNPKALTALYGGTYVLTITTPPEGEEEVSHLVHSLSKNAKKIYGLSGTQKYELPTQEVDVADVFSIIEQEKSRLNIRAWGIANTTLEDVFIKVAKSTAKVD